MLKPLKKIKQCDFDLKCVANEICFDMVKDTESSDIIEKFELTIENVRKQLSRLEKKDKSRKFRHHPEILEETFLSYSQFSLADPPSSQEENASSQKDMFSSQELLESSGPNCTFDTTTGCEQQETYQ